MEFSSKLYDVLKWVVMIFLPATSALLGAILPAYGVDAETVRVLLLTMGAVETFLGTLIGISTVSYNAKKKNAQEEE